MPLTIDRPKCLACGICMERCLLDNIRVKTPPCRAACPLGVNCQAYVTLAAMERDGDSLGYISDGIALPKTLAHVCTHPCEAACSRGQFDKPIAIRALKRFVTEAEPAARLDPPEMDGGCVAIVGAGPAGLQAAFDLRMKGHAVTVYDELSNAGGMMRLGIPEFRLPRPVLDEEVARIADLGIEMQLGQRVGQDVQFDDLCACHDAVFLAVGAHLSERLNTEGEHLAGIYRGTDFLHRRHMGERLDMGERVVVLGGGNVAVDAALVAKRLGAEDVRLVCLESREQMPAFAWEIEQALAEGILLTCGWGLKHIMPERDSVSAVHIQPCVSVFDAAGRFAPQFDASTERVLPADTLIIAVGQSPDLSFLGQSTAFELFAGSTLRVNPQTLQTALSEVFAGGDMVTGPASVVQAMAAGKRAADSIDRFLCGRDLLAGREPKDAEIARPNVEQAVATVPSESPMPVGGHDAIHVPPPRGDHRGVGRDGRTASLEAPPPSVPPLEAGGLRLPHRVPEREAPLDAGAARREADRCLRCGHAYEKYGECWSCLPCEIECPTDALKLELPFLVT